MELLEIRNIDRVIVSIDIANLPFILLYYLSLSKDRINSFSIALPTTSWIFANLIGKKFYLSVVSFAFHFLCKRMNDLTLVKDSFVFPFSKYPSTSISFAYFSIGLLAWVSCLFLETIYTEGG